MLLTVDPDLGQDLTPERFEEARRQLAVRTATLSWQRHLGHWASGASPGALGLLVLEGVLLREIHLARGVSAELLGVGDMLRPWDADGEEFLPVDVVLKWSVLSEVTVALLDVGFIGRAARWPTVLGRLSERAVNRGRSAILNQAISHLRNIEHRLLLLFWHLAERWGRVGPVYIRLELPLTHEMLAKLVGATRPTVTTALGPLARSGLVEREANGWRLSRDMAGELERILGAPPAAV
jgi:CRP/FNR family transcriptional regulator, cyclic AMP receptor protein